MRFKSIFTIVLLALIVLLIGAPFVAVQADGDPLFSCITEDTGAWRHFFMYRAENDGENPYKLYRFGEYAKDALAGFPALAPIEFRGYPPEPNSQDFDRTVYGWDMPTYADKVAVLWLYTETDAYMVDNYQQYKLDFYHSSATPDLYYVFIFDRPTEEYTDANGNWLGLHACNVNGAFTVDAVDFDQIINIRSDWYRARYAEINE